MIVAITGGNGFIGRYLVNYHLSRGDQVRILTRNTSIPHDIRVDAYSGDLAGGNSNLAEFVDGADVLYHCAAELHDIKKMHAVNVDGTARLIHAATGRIGRWIQLSSVGAYGPAQEDIVTESTNENPKGLYEVTKTQADYLVQEAAINDCFETVILRPSNVYGEGMPNQSLFKLFSMIEHGYFFFISSKGASANYIHVTDVVAGLAWCASHPNAKGETFIISNWDTMESMIEAVAGSLNSPMPKLRLPLMPIKLLASTVGRLPKMPLTRNRVDALTCRAKYSTNKIEAELGFRPQVSVKQGMSDLARLWKISSR